MDSEISVGVPLIEVLWPIFGSHSERHFLVRQDWIFWRSQMKWKSDWEGFESLILFMASSESESRAELEDKCEDEKKSSDPWTLLLDSDDHLEFTKSDVALRKLKSTRASVTQF